jgi:hypothetical protein
MTRTTRSTRRPAALAALTALAAAASLSGSPASAEAVVYDARAVSAHAPGTAPESVEHANLDVPTGYARDRRNWHKVSFVEQHGVGRVITVDLAPRADTLAKLKRQRGVIAERYAGTYRELSFTVIHDEMKAARLFRARWTYTFAAPGTEDTSPFVTVYLKGGNRLQVVGSLQDADHVRFIRDHVVRSLTFPG